MYHRDLTPPLQVDGDDLFLLPDSTTLNPFYATPERSPRVSGPALLPKIRTQDQSLEPDTHDVFNASHNLYTTPNVNPHVQRSSVFRRSSSPPHSNYLISPVSLASCSPMQGDNTSPARPSLAHGRSLSTSSIRTHVRNLSGSSIDEATRNKYAYPTYRGVPGAVTATPPSTLPTALSHLTPMAWSSSPMAASQLSPPSMRSRQSSPAQPSRLSCELVQEIDFAVQQSSSLLDYLTALNPIPSLVSQIAESGRGQNTHFWYDVRNVRSWKAFSIDAICSTKGMLALLQCPVGAALLPEPNAVNLNPDSKGQLQDMCSRHYAVKVNAALRISLGNPPMVVRSLQATRGTRHQPEFTASYEFETETTIHGAGRGRVVGIVRAYEQWNTGMKAGDATTKVGYLQGLSDLHRFMREHGCRYGFIMTEIELVCVRFGGDQSMLNNTVPYFGYMELSSAISVSDHGLKEGQIQMTAGLALWYLHMLAKRDPLPGQLGARLDIGPPAALSRHKHLDKRDDWMPKPNQSETREAKRNRGWIWPGDALHKRECGRSVKLGRMR